MYDTIRIPSGCEPKKSDAPNIWSPDAKDNRAIGAKTLNHDLRNAVYIKPPE